MSQGNLALATLTFSSLTVLAAAPAVAADSTLAWTPIADEGQGFSTSGTQTVRYGANSSWIQKTVSGPGMCTNGFFGGDPLYGVVKRCEADSTATAGWTKIADEGQGFSVSGTQTVRYGTNDRWIQKTVSGSGPCTNAFFGQDPAYGVVKRCEVGGSATPLSGTGAVPPAPPAIAQLQPGQWLELPSTRIRSVLPSPLPPGDPTTITKAWNGGTVDTRRARLLVWGGGHADYWGNEMYALDLPTMSIKRIVEPSPRAADASCSSALPDGTPTSRHTYDALTYIAHADVFYSVKGALTPCGWADDATWTRDFTASKWTLMKKGGTGPVEFGTMAEYDPVSRKVYVKDRYDFYAYSLENNTYTKLNGASLEVSYYMSGAIDTKRRKFVMIGDGVKVIDLDTAQMSTLATSNAPALVSSRQSPGVAYDPVADRIVAWHGGNQVHALNMDTGAWSQVALSGGPTASAPPQGIFGRWGYIPQYRVFALINDIDQNAWVFRLTN